MCPCYGNVHEMLQFLLPQNMYSKYPVNVIAMSLILEICWTHQISDTIRNVHEMSCVYVMEMYIKHEISDTTENVQEISCVRAKELYMKSEISGTPGNA